MFRWMKKRDQETGPVEEAGDARRAPEQDETAQRAEEWRKQQEATVIATTTSVTF